MSSALNLAAKGSQFVIRGAKGLSRNVHAMTRQPTVPGIPRESRPRSAGPRGQIPPRVEGSEKQDLLTLGLCLLSISTLSTQPLPRAFFFPPENPVSYVSQGPPAHTLWLLLTLPDKLYWGLGTALLSVGLRLSSQCLLFRAVSSVSVLGSPAQRYGRDLICFPPPAPPMGSLRSSQLT